jgi:hypothetical protein
MMSVGELNIRSGGVAAPMHSDDVGDPVHCLQFRLPSWEDLIVWALNLGVPRSPANPTASVDPVGRNLACDPRQLFIMASDDGSDDVTLQWQGVCEYARNCRVDGMDATALAKTVAEELATYALPVHASSVVTGADGAIMCKV